MSSYRFRLPSSITPLLVGAISLVGCSSTTSTSTDSGSTTSSASTTVLSATTVVGATTTAARTTVKTTAPATAAPTTKPPVTTAGPQITSFSVSDPAACAAPDVSVALPPPTVTISWTVTGADSVHVAIDNEDGAWETNLAFSGSIEVPFACPGPHTYFVVAEKAGQPRAVKSKTRP